jgi:hypothetical protein
LLDDKQVPKACSDNSDNSGVMSCIEGFRGRESIVLSAIVLSSISYQLEYKGER